MVRWLVAAAQVMLGVLVTLAGGYMGAVIGSHIAAKQNDDVDSWIYGVIGAISGGLAGLVVTGVLVICLFIWLDRRDRHRASQWSDDVPSTYAPQEHARDA